MNSVSRLQGAFSHVRRLAAGMLLACGGMAGAHAADVYVTAEFKPDLNDPNQREFVNTTPWTGVCAAGHKPTCIANDWWSIDTTIRGVKHAVRQADWGPNGFYIRIPGPRTVTVTSDDGASSFDLDLRIIGSAMRVTDADRDGEAWGFVSGGGSRDCDNGIRGYSEYTDMRMLLSRNGGESSVACSLHWMNTNNYRIDALDFVYALRTPSPLGMRSGVYTGATTYTYGATGEGTDFDLGHGAELTDRSVTVHFRLEVRHAFQLALAPGSDRAILAPRGGWSQWSDHGIAPERLERDVPFSISSTGTFSVSTQCQYTQPDGRCAIRNITDTAEDVPLDVTLTLPGFKVIGSDQAALDVPLVPGGHPPLFGADSVIIGRPSRLRFAVNGAAVGSLLAHPGSRYQGEVTVVFDADP